MLLRPLAIRLESSLQNQMQSNDLLTLYVTRPVLSITQRLPQERIVDGVLVKVWMEHGLFCLKIAVMIDFGVHVAAVQSV
jgi:hypothetical protein